MASFNSIIRHYTIPELKKELDKLTGVIYDEDQSEDIHFEAQIRACYVQRELQHRGVDSF